MSQPECGLGTCQKKSELRAQRKANFGRKDIVSLSDTFNNGVQISGATMPDKIVSFFPSTIIEWMTLTALPLAGLWGLVNFHRSNRHKAAELLLVLEKEYEKHIPLLLKIENLPDYFKHFKEAIKIAIYEKEGPYTPAQSNSIDELDAALRHFFVCVNVRRFGIDGGAIDRLCAWYLRVLVTDSDEPNRYLRPELRTYIQRYWPQIFFWAPLASVPIHKRIIVYISQIPERIRVWKTGEWAAPPKSFLRAPLRPLTADKIPNNLRPEDG